MLAWFMFGVAAIATAVSATSSAIFASDFVRTRCDGRLDRFQLALLFALTFGGTFNGIVAMWTLMPRP